VSIYQDIRTQAAAAFGGINNPHYTAGSAGFAPRVMAAPPTVTQSATNPLSTGRQYNAQAAAQATAFNVQAGVEISNSNSICWYTLTQWTSGSGGLSWLNPVPPPRSGTMTRIRFCTTAAQISIAVIVSSKIRFIVDGVFVSLALAITLQPFIVLDFTAVGGAAARTIEIEIASSAGLLINTVRGVWVPTTASVYAPRYITPIKWIQMGDSLTLGGYATYLPDAYSNVMGDYLGISNLWSSGLGSTGYIRGPDLGSPLFNALQRLPYDALPYFPDVYGFAFGVNDVPYPVSDVVNNMLRCIGWIRGQQPETPIFVWGVWFLQNSEAVCTTLETAMFAAIKDLVAQGDQNLFCIPVMTDSGGAWIVESQRTTFLIDSVHPNTIGHQYYGMRSAQAVLEAIKDKV